MVEKVRRRDENACGLFLGCSHGECVSSHATSLQSPAPPPVPPPGPLQPMPTPSCANWCSTDEYRHKTPKWLIKCTWVGYTGCSQCILPSPVPSPPPLSPPPPPPPPIHRRRPHAAAAEFRQSLFEPMRGRH